VEFVRIGTRIPIFLPQRITPELCEMLRQFHPLFISIHSNHPRELTLEVREALDAWPTPAFRSATSRCCSGTSTTTGGHEGHVQKLLLCRVRPYYIYQCDLIAGSAHLRTSVRRGVQIMDALRGHTTGYAVPHYVIDAPGGGAKCR